MPVTNWRNRALISASKFSIAFQNHWMTLSEGEYSLYSVLAFQSSTSIVANPPSKYWEGRGGGREEREGERREREREGREREKEKGGGRIWSYV